MRYALYVRRDLRHCLPGIEKLLRQANWPAAFWLEEVVRTATVGGAYQVIPIKRLQPLWLLSPAVLCHVVVQSKSEKYHSAFREKYGLTPLALAKRVALLVELAHTLYSREEWESYLTGACQPPPAPPPKPPF